MRLNTFSVVKLGRSLISFFWGGGGGGVAVKPMRPHLPILTAATLSISSGKNASDIIYFDPHLTRTPQKSITLSACFVHLIFLFCSVVKTTRRIYHPQQLFCPGNTLRCRHRRGSGLVVMVTGVMLGIRVNIRR